jgi:pentatricopeptide repeat protein
MHSGVVWNTVILQHVKCGEGQKAVELFWKMPLDCDQGGATCCNFDQIAECVC